MESETGILFRDYFCSACGLIEKSINSNSQNNGNRIEDDDLEYINELMIQIKTCLPLLQEDEKFALSCSRIIKLSNKAWVDTESKSKKIENENDLLKDDLDEVKQNYPDVFDLESLFPYFKNLLNLSTNPETIENLIKTLISIFSEHLHFNNDGKLLDDYFNIEKACEFIPIIRSTLINKYNQRNVVESSLKYLDMLTARKEFAGYFIKELKNEKSALYGIDIVQPIAIALTKHKYESLTQLKSINFQTIQSQQNTETTKKNENIVEERINIIGGRILERLVGEADLKKFLKELKDSISSFNPENYNIQSITNLENSLQTFLAFLESQKLFFSCFKDVLSEIRNFIKKEIFFIENFKRKQENSKKENYNEVVSSSSKRLQMALGIVQKINIKCQEIIEESDAPEAKMILIEGVKNVINTSMEIFDKSTDISCLNSLLESTKNDIDFILNNSSDLSTKSKNEEKSLFDIFKNKKFDNIQFEDNIIEKIINSLMSLLRRMPEEPLICEKVIKILMDLIEKDPDIANTLVKNGCPKLLLQLLETGNNENLIKSALQLIQKIGESNSENLEMLSNQDLINKLYEINTNFGPGLSEYSGPILSALMKLPVNEAKIKEIILTTLREFITNANELPEAQFFSKKLAELLEIISKLNVFVCRGGKHVSLLLGDEDFKKAFNILVDHTNQENDLSKTKEPLLKNECEILDKMFDYCNLNAFVNSDLENEKEDIVKTSMTMVSNINFRDALVSSLSLLYDYIGNSDDPIPFEKLKDSLNEAFVDNLFEISDNYLDDTEVLNYVNNIICALCFNSDSLSKYIIKKGGLKNVVNELKYLVKSDSESAQIKKRNNLKLINNLILDKENMQKFLKLNGSELINSILRHEVKRSDEVIIKNQHDSESILGIHKPNVEIEKKNNKEKEKEKEKSQEDEEKAKDRSATTVNKTFKKTLTRSGTIRPEKVIEENAINNNTQENYNFILPKFICLNEKHKEHLLGESFSFGEFIPLSLEIANQLISEGNKMGNHFNKMVIDLGSRSFSDKAMFEAICKVFQNQLLVDQKLITTGTPISSIRSLSQLVISGLSQFNDFNDINDFTKSISKNVSSYQRSSTLNSNNRSSLEFSGESAFDSSETYTGLKKKFSENIQLQQQPAEKSLSNDLKESISNILHNLSDENELKYIKLLCEKIALMKKSPDSEKYFNNEIISQFLCYVHCAILNNFHNAKDDILKIKQSLIAALSTIYQHINELVTDQAGINAFISLLTIVGQNDERDLKDIFDDKTLFRKLFNLVSKFIVPENMGFINVLLDTFENLFSVKSGSKILNRDYLEYLKNIYLRSFEILDFYYNLVDPTINLKFYTQEFQKELPVLANVIENLKNCICTYWKSECDLDYKLSTLKRLGNTCLKFIGNTNIKSFAIKKPFWEILYNMTSGDKKNYLLENEDLCLSIIDLLEKELAQNPQEELLRNFIQLLSDRLTTQDIISERLLKLISKDIASHKEEIPGDILSKHLKCLGNLVDVPIIPRILGKDKFLVHSLNHFYNDSSFGSAEDRLNITKIMKKLFANELNNEVLIKECPGLYTGLFDKLLVPLDLEDARNEQISNNEIDCLVSLISNEKTYQSLIDNELINLNKLNDIFSLHESNPKISTLQNEINKIKEKVSAEEKLLKNKKEISELVNYVNELYKKNLQLVEEMHKQGIISESKDYMRNSSVRVSRFSKNFNSICQPNTPLFPIFGDEDPNAEAFKSELSVKNNKELNSTIDKLLLKINSMYNEVKKDFLDNKENAEIILTDDNFKEKFFLIKDLFKALKKLCLHPDNHKTILELGLNDILNKFYDDDAEELKNFLLIDALQSAKLCTTSPNAINSFIKSNAANTVLDDMLKRYTDMEVLVTNDALKKIFILANGVFTNLCKTKEGFDFVFDKIGLGKLLEMSKRTHSPEILGTIQSTILNYIKSGNSVGSLIQEISAFNLKCAKLHKKTPKMLVDALLIAGSLVGTPESKNKQSINEKIDIKALSEIKNSLDSVNISENTLTDSSGNYDTPKLVKTLYKRKSINYDPALIQVQNSLITQASKDFTLTTINTENFNALLFYLGKVSNESVSSNIEIERSELIQKIGEKFIQNDINCPVNEQFSQVSEESQLETSRISIKLLKDDLYSNDAICENFTNLVSNLLNFSSENIKKFCEADLIESILKILDRYKDNENNQVILNCLICLDSVSIQEIGVRYLSEHKNYNFVDLMMQIIQEKEKDNDVTKYSLKNLSNYFQKNIISNYKNLNLEAIIQLLIDTQKKYYAVSDILIYINDICSYLINNLSSKDSNAKEKLFRIIISSINIQESNPALVNPALTTISELISKHENLMEEVAENYLTTIIQVFNNHLSNSESCIQACKILKSCAVNPIYSYSMTNFGLLQQIDKVLDYYSTIEGKEKEQLEKEVFELLALLAKDDKCSEKISMMLMKHIIKGFSDIKSVNNISMRKLLINLTKHGKSIAPFIQFKGEDAIKNNLQNDGLEPQAIFDIFKIINHVIDSSDDYKKEMHDEKIHEIVKELIPKYVEFDKKIEFEGKCKQY